MGHKNPLWDKKVLYGTRKSSTGHKNPLRDKSPLRETKNPLRDKKSTKGHKNPLRDKKILYGTKKSTMGHNSLLWDTIEPCRKEYKQTGPLRDTKVHCGTQ